MRLACGDWSTAARQDWVGPEHWTALVWTSTPAPIANWTSPAQPAQPPPSPSILPPRATTSSNCCLGVCSNLRVYQRQPKRDPRPCRPNRAGDPPSPTKMAPVPSDSASSLPTQYSPSGHQGPRHTRRRWSQRMTWQTKGCGAALPSPWTKSASMAPRPRPWRALLPWPRLVSVL